MGWDDVRSDSLDHLSDAQISMFQRCPRQYEFRYIKGKKQPPKSALLIGKAVHSGIEVNYFNKFKNKRAIGKDVVLDAYDKAFEGGKSGIDFEGQPSGRVKDIGYRMSEAHYHDVAPSFQPTRAPEFKFEIPIPGVKKNLLGYIDAIGDLLDRPGPGEAVIDNKTSRRSWDQWHVDLSGQLTAYSYAYRKLFKKIPRLLGIDAIIGNSKGVSTQRLVTLRDEDQLARYEKTVQQVDAGIRSGNFYPTDNPMTCSWCGYNEICHKRAVTAKG